jgi:hypothetical protein
MAIHRIFHEPWTRKHDEPGVPLIPHASTILYPESLKDLIDICRARQPAEFFKAAGSHWALSDAAISDTTFIETHDPNNTFPAMDRTLYDVVPGCLTTDFKHMLAAIQPARFAIEDKGATENAGYYLVHFETGKTVYQLYADLDKGDDANEKSLAVLMKTQFNNDRYLGPWAFRTLGGAGGQTVFGALNYWYTWWRHSYPAHR